MKNASSNSSPNRDRSRVVGVTMIELLLVLVIISLLATLAVPTVVKQQRNSRIAAAKSEARNLAIAQSQVGMLYDFYVPLQWLDDGPETSLPAVDNIGNEPFGAVGAGGSALVSTLISTSNQVGNQVDFIRGNRRVDRLIDNWDGPFIQFQRFWQQNKIVTDLRTLRLDFPLDPWGNPYVFYSERGAVGAGAGVMAESDIPPLAADWDATTTQGLEQFSNGLLTELDIRLDRYAIVSFGPDGIRNSRLTDGDDLYGDDIVHFFGQLEPETIL